MMAKLLLHYRTTLGPRTIIAEVADRETASAVMNAHLALGENASLCSEMPRLSMRDHQARRRKSREKAALKVIASDPKVTPIRAKAKKP